MTNGLGAGFFALALLAVVAGLAGLVIITTVAAAMYQRRTGEMSALLGYLLVGLCLGVVIVAGFGILALFDELAVVAWLLAWSVVIPLLVEGVYLNRTMGFSQVEVITTTVMAWGVPFLLGVGVVVGVLSGITSVFGLSPVETRQLGVAWIAATIGGLTVILGMLPLGTRIGRFFYSAPVSR